MRVFLRNRRALLGLVGLALFLLMAAVGPLVVPLDRMPDPDLRFEPPSLRHLLGTDYAGRDTFAQLVHGSRDIVLISFFTGAFTIGIALAVGLSAGLAGGRVDGVLTGVTDIFLTVPQFPVMAIMAALIRVTDPVTFGLVLAIWAWPGAARSLRAQVVSLRGREFVEAAHVMALSPWWILSREILPNLVPSVSLAFIRSARDAITVSVGIMLLGLVPLKVENWGMMLNLAAFQSGALYVPRAWAYLLSPLLAIVAFQFCLIQLAGGLEELVDPRLRRRG